MEPPSKDKHAKEKSDESHDSRTSGSTNLTVPSPIEPEERDKDWKSNLKRLEASYPNAGHDFYGIPSGALCIYKSGTAWPVTKEWRIHREARGVHGHPIQAVWHNLGKNIYTFLDDKDVLWTSIDVVAFAEVEKPIFSRLLIWIGVQPASLTYEKAQKMAEAILSLLSQAGFSDFEVAFRESVVTRSATGPKMLAPDIPTTASTPFRKHFMPVLGLSIAPVKRSYHEDIGALYFRESKDSGRVFLLTCAHVARPPAVHNNQGLAGKTESSPREHIMALGSSTYANVLKSMQDAIVKQCESIEVFQYGIRSLGEPRADESDEVISHRIENLYAEEIAKKNIDKFTKLHDEIFKQWGRPDHRIIGEVVYVAPLEVNSPPHGFTTDWALIELYKDKFDWTIFPGNKIYVEDKYSLLEYRQTMFPRHQDSINWDCMPSNGLLQARGVISRDDLWNPGHRDANDEPCLFVVKNGRSSGTTFGRATGLESFLRTIDDYGIKQTSVEIAIYTLGEKYGAFSKPGDSGSIVLDRTGRILGMVTAGAGLSERTDVTYATPYGYLESKIKEAFPKSFLYEVVPPRKP